MSILKQCQLNCYTGYYESIIYAKNIEILYSLMYNNTRIYLALIELGNNHLFDYYSNKDRNVENTLLIKRNNYDKRSELSIINDANKSLISYDDFYKNKTFYDYEKEFKEFCIHPENSYLINQYLEVDPEHVEEIFLEEHYFNYFNENFKIVEPKYLIENKLSKESFIKLIEYFSSQKTEIFKEPILEIIHLGSDIYNINYKRINNAIKKYFNELNN